MINVDVEFPVLGLREDDGNVYVFSSHIGIVSKGGHTFYKRLRIIDSSGNTFLLSNSELKGKAPIKYSFKYFQQMYEMDLTFEKEKKVTLDELKQRVFAHISKYQQKWVNLGTVELVQEKMNKCTSYKQLIEMFK